ncbi:MAG: sugar ABC transporter permease [Treponema sp.]|nr:sugar ABC transporter permease [Treponema sp.]
MLNGGNQKKINRWGYFFVTPFVVVFCIFYLWPTIYTFALSFTDLKGLRSDFNFIGFANFQRLLQDKTFLTTIKNTLIISWSTFIPQLCIAMILAIWLSDMRLNLKGRSIFRAAIFLPNLLTAASISVLFRNFFTYPNGFMSQLLYSAGLHQTVLRDGTMVTQAYEFFRNGIFTRGLTSFIFWWMYYGSTNIILMAGITSINPTLYESAVVDGANSRQTTWHITLPLLRPIILYVFFTSMIGGMQAFDVPFLLTTPIGSPNNSILTMSMYVYNVGFRGDNNKSFAASISIGIFVLTMILALIIFFFLQDRSDLQKSKTRG